MKLDVQINTHQCIKSNHIAELGQQIERNWGDKVWVCSIFQWLVEKNMNNERVIRYWLLKYKLDMKLYKVRLTCPSTEAKVALVKHLRVCSINDSGVDSHVKRNWEYFLIEMGVIRNLSIRVVQMSPYVRVNPGIDLK